jgi:hypothetical protein
MPTRECATRRHVTGWDERTHRWAVAAARLKLGQPGLGGAREGGSSPDNDGTVRDCQTGRVRQARQNGATTSEPVVEPPQAAIRLEPGGWGSVSSARRHRGSAVCGDSGGHSLCARGGHGEGLRRTRGEAAGEKLGTTPADRHMVNVGSARVPPFPPHGQWGGGQARRRLMASGRGGAPVVVRGQESCPHPHGEGGQRVRSRGTGRPGGRR